MFLQTIKDAAHAEWLITTDPVRARLRYFKAIMLRVFLYGDTTTIRAFFAVSSGIFGADLLMHPEILARPYYVDMTFMPYWAWAAAFLVHTAGVLWRFLDKPRLYWGFAVNAWGLFLWVTCTWLLSKGTPQGGGLPPTLAMEITAILAGFIALVRTGKNDDQASP